MSVEDRLDMYLTELGDKDNARITAYFKSITKDKDYLKMLGKAAKELGGGYTISADNIPPRAKFIGGVDIKHIQAILKKNGIKTVRVEKERVYFE